MRLALLLGMILAPAIAHAQLNILPFRPVGAEYSTALDRLILISTNPNQIHIYAPDTQIDVVVNLAKAPLALSISPDGQHAVVGHDGLISYVNLAAGSVERTFSIPFSVQAIVLTTDWIYAQSSSYSYGIPNTVSIRIATGVSTPATLSYVASVLRFDSALNTVYGAYNGLLHFDISTGPMTSVTSLSYSSCTQVFVSSDGTRIYPGCGPVVRASADTTQDGRYIQAVPGVAQIKSLTESSATRRIALIPFDSSYNSTNPDNQIRLFETAHLNLVAQFALMDFQAVSRSYKAHGKWVFFNAASSLLYAVTQADSTSGFLNDFGIQTVSLSTAIPCTAGFGSASATVVGDGAMGTVNIVSTSGCSYQPVSNASWLQLVAGGFGSGNGTLTYIARANTGAARTATISIGTAAFTVSQDAATGPEALIRLPYNVAGAAYDKPLDKLVMITSSPNELHTYDPVTRIDQSVALFSPPLSLSIRPDGRFAAVGHDGWISYVDLQTMSVTQSFQLSTDAGAIVLASNGYIYFSSANYYSYAIYSLQISTGTISSPSSCCGGQQVLRLTVDGAYVYTSGVSKWSTANGVLSAVSANSYVSSCNNVWLTEDGRRLFTACGKAYRISTSSDDLQANGGLSSFNTVNWVDESATLRETAAIQGPDYYYSSQPTTADTSVSLFGDAYLDFAGSFPLPQFSIDSRNYAAHGKYVFWNRASDRLFAIASADSTAGLASPFAVVPIVPSTSADGCTFTLRQTLFGEPASGGLDSIPVDTAPNCVWTAVSGASWITVTAGAFASGSATLTFTVDANTTGQARQATLTVAGQSVTVVQSISSCTYSLNQTDVTLHGPGSGSFGVIAPPGCAWTARSNAAWLSISGAATGIGSGNVNYTAAVNDTASARSTTISVAGLNFVVNQDPGVPVPVLSDLRSYPPGLSQTVSSIYGKRFTLTLSGNNFDTTSRVFLGAVPLTTTFVNSFVITAEVPTITTAGATAVTVVNTGGLVSNAINLNTIQRGDINSSRNVNVGDALVEALTLAGLTRPELATSVGDVNFNGAANIGDALTIALFAGHILPNLPTPVITSLSPIPVAPGAALTIIGTGFSTTPADNQVVFPSSTGGVSKAIPSAASLTALTVTVPGDAVSGGLQVIRLDVDVGGQQAPLLVSGSTPRPIISGIAPFYAVNAGSSITIAGVGFDSTTAANAVTFRGLSGPVGATVTAAGLTALAVTVPSGAQCGPVSVTTAAGTSNSRTVMVAGTTCPLLLADLFGGNLPGDTVVIEGSGFDSSVPANNIVRFTSVNTGTVNGTVIQAGNSQLHVRAPDQAGPGPVLVAVGSQTSNSISWGAATDPAGVSVSVSSGTAVGSYQVRITYDKNVVQLSPGSVSGGNGPGFTVTPTAVNIDNASGFVDINAFQTGNSPSGTFTVANLVFTPVAAGTSPLTLSVTTLTDTNGVELARPPAQVTLSANSVRVVRVP